MDVKRTNRWLFFIVFFVCLASLSYAQSTIISGTVTDAKTRLPVSLVNISFTDGKTGVTTDLKGKYVLRSDSGYTRIKVSRLGYKDAYFRILPGKAQVLDINLISTSTQLNEVQVLSQKKQKYSNIDNPAVELIRKVIANKEKNRPQNYQYAEYRAYDKILFSFANLSTKVTDKKFLKKYDFLFNNRDTTIVPGKSLTPGFLQEKLVQYYYRKNPEKTKTITLGQKTVNFGGPIDNEGLSAYFKYIIYDVDLYSNSIFLLTSNFLSPIANSAPSFYKFFITDTITVNSTKVVELSFTPRNTSDVLFEGRLYVTLDGNYAVQGAELSVNKNINLNFVRSLTVKQQFEQNSDGRYHLSRNSTIADFGATRNQNSSLFGIRTVTYKNFIINNPRPDTIYEKQEQAVSEQAKNRSDLFWTQNRLDTLSNAESKVYKNIDSLRNMPSYQRTLDIGTILLSGYKDFGAFEIGPLNTFYSFNPIEGLKLRVGGRTTPALSKRYYFENYIAYGFKDKRWKFFQSATYSINNKSIYKFPQDYLRASVQRDTKLPGTSLQFIGEDNILLAFKHGNNTKYLYDENYRLDYVHEYQSHFSYNLSLRKLSQSPAGSLYFIYTNDLNLSTNVSTLTTTELALGFRYAPHEQFYQGKVYRSIVPGPYPIFSFDYISGVKDLFGGQYNYENIHGRIDKRFYLSQLGFADVTVEAAHLFGQVPYPLLNIFHANQTYSYAQYSYNLMNYLEFVADHYETLNIDQHFNGFFFNKIPLLKKLRWRELATLKVIYGGLSDSNNPALHHSLYQFPVYATGQPITYGLGKTPYVEAGVGVENIFKIIRIDLVKRFTYLDNPGVIKLGIRTSIGLNF